MIAGAQHTRQQREASLGLLAEGKSPNQAAGAPKWWALPSITNMYKTMEIKGHLLLFLALFYRILIHFLKYDLDK